MLPPVLPVLLVALLRAAGVVAFSESPVWPVQLLTPTNENYTHLRVVESGMKALEGLQGPVATVAVVGPYHSGKSFLLNNLVGHITGRGLQSAFEVGKSVDPSTRGIWAYYVGRVQLDDDRGEVDLVFLDTEGFSVANVSQAYDAKIFAASAVLSSTLIFNTMHIIDSTSLEYLDLLAHNTQLFALSTAAMAEAQHQPPPLAPNTTHTADRPRTSPAELFSLPPLLWTVQAFTLNLQGEACTAWLQRMLASAVLAPHDCPLQQQQQQQQQQHLGISGLFPSMECHTLYLPAHSRSQLHDLASVTHHQLTDDYLEDVSSVSSALLRSLRPKRRGGQPLHGAHLSAMTHIVVEALNKGVLSNIPSRWDVFENHLRMSSVRAAVHHFESEVVAAMRNRSVPIANLALKGLVANVRGEAMALVPRLLMGLDVSAEQSATKEVTRHISKIADMLVKENEQAVKEYVSRVKVDMDEQDRAKAMEQADTLLPLPSKTLQELTAERERASLGDFQTSTLAYQGEGWYGRELKDLRNKLSARSKTLKQQNDKAVDAQLRTTEDAVFKWYTEHMDESLGDGPVVPARINELQGLTTVQTKTRLVEQALNFTSEPSFYACTRRLETSMKAHADTLHTENHRRIGAFCANIRSAIAQNATQTAQAHFSSNDEIVVESAVKSITAMVASFPSRAAPHERTETCRHHHHLLHEEAKALHKLQRERLAANLREVLREPLIEICKVVVDSQCRFYRSMSSLRSFVEKECSKWVRRKPEGKAVSDAALRSVLSLMMERDLAACVEEVKLHEQVDRAAWLQFTGVMALLGLLAVAVVLFKPAGSTVGDD